MISYKFLPNVKDKSQFTISYDQDYKEQEFVYEQLQTSLKRIRISLQLDKRRKAYLQKITSLTTMDKDYFTITNKLIQFMNS